jgi:hypothetical protein
MRMSRLNANHSKTNATDGIDNSFVSAALTGQPSFVRHPKQIMDSSTDEVNFTSQKRIVPTTRLRFGSAGTKRPLASSSEEDMSDGDEADLTVECLESIVRKKRRQRIILATAHFSETCDDVMKELNNCLLLLNDRIACTLCDIDTDRCNVKLSENPCKFAFLGTETIERRAMEAAVVLASTSNCVLQLAFRMSVAKQQHEEATRD